MMRMETTAIAAARGEAQLRNVWGLAWNPAATENTTPETALVTLEAEYEDGTRGSLYLRPRVWYGFGQKVTRAWLTSAAGAGTVLALDVGHERGDVAQGASGGAATPALDRWEAVQTSQNGQNFGATPWVLDFVRPDGAVGFVLYGKEDASVGPKPMLGLTLLDLVGGTEVQVTPVPANAYAANALVWSPTAIVQRGATSFGTLPDGGTRIMHAEPPTAIVRCTVAAGDLDLGAFLYLRARWLFA